MRILLVFLTAVVTLAQTTPTVNAVMNGASFSGNLCPGALATLLGSNLANDTSVAQSLPLPRELGGTSVMLQDPSTPDPIFAPLYYVSPEQINFQVPFDIGRTSVSISVSTSQGISNALDVDLSPTAPEYSYSQSADQTGTLARDVSFNLLCIDNIPQLPIDTDNAANVTGKVTILYPTDESTIDWSPAFVVAKVAVQFDVKPSAGRFTLSVVAKVGSTTVDGTTIQFDPVLGQFTANVPSPTISVRLGDFSKTGISAMDFCCTGTGSRFPGNMVPHSRIDRHLLSVLDSVPLPNTAPSGTHSSYTVTGGVRTGSTFTMAGSTNVDLMPFASFGSIPYPTDDVPVSVTLYIDGQVIDTAIATYKHL